MKLRIPACGLILSLCAWAGDPIAAQLAREAHEAEESGQLVRAYLLYAEAAARDPSNTNFRANRDGLASVASLLTKADIQKADISSDIRNAERDAKQTAGAEPPVETVDESDWHRDPGLQPLPELQPAASMASFNLTGNTTFLFRQVATTFGITVLFDPELPPEKNIHFSIDHADFRTVMEALTAVTHTFLFPVSEHEIAVAEDKESKRNELEPRVLVTFPLPDAVEQKDVIEAANAVRGILNLRSIGWDSINHIVLIRDRVTRARVGRALMEALLRPKAQVSIEVQFMTVDTDKNYHYGASLPSAFQLLDFGHIGGFQSVLANVTSPANFFAFGGGATLFGIALSDATLFATYSNAVSDNIFDATVVVGDGQTASLHVGDKYPIPQTLYTGAQQTAPSIYNPIGEFTTEDLGLMLKMTPRIGGNEDVSIDVEADFKSLGTQTIDTVPEINEREFKGTVTLREGQLAVIAGMNSSTHSRAKTGLRGLADIPGLDQILAENTRETQTSQTLVVIKPTITRLPMEQYAGPQYVLGPERGERVVL